MNKIKFAATSLLVIFLAGCETTPPEPVEVSEVQTLEATVVAVDAADRFLVLRGPQGNEIGLRAGPEVRNLQQVSVGDILSVNFYTGLAVSMADPGDAGADLEVAAGRAEEGQMPGAMVGASVRQTVEILSVADDGTAVSFRDADGRIQSIDVKRPEGREFAKKLKQGDLVDIRYTEAVAIAVSHTE